jgi:hypothetical protein
MNASNICAMLSKACREEALIKSNVFKWHNQFKEGCKKMEDDEDNARHFLQYQEYCSLGIHSTRPNSQPSLLCVNIEAVT